MEKIRVVVLSLFALLIAPLSGAIAIGLLNNCILGISLAVAVAFINAYIAALLGGGNERAALLVHITTILGCLCRMQMG